MIGNPAAAYLGGDLHQQLPTLVCGPGGPVITLITISPHYCPTHFCPTHHVHLCPTHFVGHCSIVCGTPNFRTIFDPPCIPRTLPPHDIPGPNPLMHAMAAPQQADCKNVMWTAGCTFAA